MIDWQKAIDSALGRLLGDPTPPNLAASIRYSMLSPGKRFRPRLMSASALMLGVTEEDYVPFAVALEMIHGFTLIHDDLPCMDDDDLRRGMPTNHKVHGEALALLAGDALIPAAFEWTLTSRAASAPSREPWFRAFSHLLEGSGPRGVIGGQAQEFALDSKTTLGELRTLHALKTGALFDAALLIPAHLAGLNPESKEFQLLKTYSQAFGLGFQVADDLEDAATEWDEALGYPHTSVLSHQSFEEARAKAIHSLESASRNLQDRWGSSAKELELITQQLLEKLIAPTDPHPGKRR
ncbi:MAG: polyprenyl synthetase family protein [Oligoflexia bacterium]